MRPFRIEQTFQTPFINLDPKASAFEISGNSMPNNPHGFYMPVLEWLDEYALNSNPENVFVFRLTYQNSSSKKMFHEMMKTLERIHRSGKKVRLDWHYPSDDDDMFHSGVEIQKSFSFEVKCIRFDVSSLA